MQVDDVSTPSPQAGQVLVRLAAAGINYIDVYQRTGVYPNALPYTMGLEGSGVVAGIGPNVTGFQEGDPVAYTGIPGSYAEMEGTGGRPVRMPKGLDIKVMCSRWLQAAAITGLYYLPAETWRRLPHPCRRRGSAVATPGARWPSSVGYVCLVRSPTEDKAALAREAGADEIILTPGRTLSRSQTPDRWQGCAGRL
jgi:NADPH2:quinone reductase